MSPSIVATDATADERVDPVPRFLVAMRHPTTRRYVCDLIEQHCRCWIATSSPDPCVLTAALDDLRPDALIIEAATLRDAAAQLSARASHIVVIGPEPDDTYRDHALAAGADAWIARDRLANDLVTALETVQCDPTCNCGCHHHPRAEEERS